MNPQRGAALIVAVMGVCLTGALAASLAVLTGTEIRIATNYANAREAAHAAEAGLEIAMRHLSAEPDWAAIVSGTASSTFVDGLPGGTRTLSDGSMLDLAELTSQIALENPTRRLIAFGPLNQIQSKPDLDSSAYVMVWVGSDPSGDEASVLVRADAFGPAGTRRGVEARVSRTEEGATRIRSWWDVR